MQAVTRMPQ